MSKVSFSNLNWQYQIIKKDLLAEIELLLESGQYTNGKYVKTLEDNFSIYANQKYSVGVNSGTSALHAGLMAMGIGPGDEVIAPSHTFIASVNAIVLTGATPVLVDVDQHGLLDGNATMRAITSKTKAVMPVHLYGSLVSEDTLREVSNKNIKIIEDASQAHGAKFPSGLPVGTYGDVTAFSFYPGKNLGAAGEAGMLTTNNEELAEKAKLFRNWGAPVRYQHDYFGLNYRMDEIQALILIRKLEHLNQWNNLRVEIADYYKNEMKKLSIQVVNNHEGNAVYHQFIISIEERDELQVFLKSQGIETLIHYPIAIHKQLAISDKVRISGSLENTEMLTPKILSLPIYPGLKIEEAQLVVRGIIDFYATR